MEKGKRIQAIDDQLQLPKEIIEQIQSFLDGKQAASTAVLSKSWYDSWLTRPCLDFDERYFQEQNSEEKFLNFVKRSIERYRESNLSIDSFKLWMNVRDIDSSSLATELIVKAVRMGAKFIDLEFNPPNHAFVLPHVVFGSENLTRLSVSGCTINPPVDGRISCSRLAFLSLSKVRVVDNIVGDIISSCPLLEKLSSSRCKWTWRSPSIESCELHKLKYLSLSNMRVDSLFFHDLSRKLPCLEDLSLLYCDGYRDIRISSHSLKCINLGQSGMLRAKFDVPNIRKFTYFGFSIPSLSFPTASGEWESNIKISCSEHHLRAEWFGDLKELLIKLSLSKISLNIELDVANCIDCEGLIEGLPKPVVENLILSIYTRSAIGSPFLDGLFWCCRPKLIRQYWTRRSSITDKPNHDFLQLICKKLIPEVSQNCYRPSQNMADLHDLKEVNAEVFDQTLAEWKPLPWEYLLDASPHLGIALKVRFQLKWSSPSHASLSSRPSQVLVGDERGDF